MRELANAVRGGENDPVCRCPATRPGSYTAKGGERGVSCCRAGHCPHATSAVLCMPCQKPCQICLAMPKYAICRAGSAPAAQDAMPCRVRAMQACVLAPCVTPPCCALCQKVSHASMQLCQPCCSANASFVPKVQPVPHCRLVRASARACRSRRASSQLSPFKCPPGQPPTAARNLR